MINFYKDAPIPMYLLSKVWLYFFDCKFLFSTAEQKNCDDSSFPSTKQ